MSVLPPTRERTLAGPYIPNFAIYRERLDLSTAAILAPPLVPCNTFEVENDPLDIQVELPAPDNALIAPTVLRHPPLPPEAPSERRFSSLVVGLCLASVTLLALVLMAESILSPKVLSTTAAGLTTAVVLAASGIALLWNSLKQNEEELGELEHLKEALQKAVSDHDPAAFEKKQTLRLAQFGHELRTPLTAMHGFADHLLGQPQSRDSFSALTSIKRNADHLLELINNLLDLSKASAGKLKPEHLPVQPRQIVRDVIETIAICAGDKPVRLSSEVAPDVPDEISTDPTRLRQILNNLVSNSLKFTSQGFIRVDVDRIENDGIPFLRFRVVDSGIGIAPEKAERLFEPYAQADGSTTRLFGGTGLGLVISRELAQHLGGDLTLTGQLGIGTTATLTIRAERVSTRSTAPRPSQPDGRVDLSQLRILLVDDSPDNPRLISIFLRKANAVVEVAGDGEQACALALAAEGTAEPFDLILMDLNLPVLDGLAATERLIQAGYPRPILILTAHTPDEVGDRCRQAGARGMATKPIDRAGLIQLIAQHTGRLGESVPRESDDAQLLEALR